MPNFSRTEIVLVRFPFSDLTNFKVRPGVIISGVHTSNDVFIVALTSQTKTLVSGEFVLHDWKAAGLNVETAVKRGIFTIHQKLILKSVGQLSDADAEMLDQSLRVWMEL